MSKLLHSRQSAYVGQNGVSPQRRLPVDDGVTANAQQVTGETIQFYYYTSAGVLTLDAGEAAGTIVVATLTNKNVLNSLGDGVGNYGDTSFSFGTGTILTQFKPFRGLLAEDAELTGELALQAAKNRAIAVTEGFQNGWYTIDHEHGVIYGKKATTGTADTGSYKVLVSGGGGTVSENVNLAKIGGTAVTTALTTTATVTGFLGTTPRAVYNATPTVRTEGQTGPFQADTAGNIKETLGTTISGENQTLDTMGVMVKPSASNAYTGTPVQNNSFTTSNLKATFGNVLTIQCINTTASVRYLQLHNTATTPGGGATAQEKYLVPANSQIILGPADLGTAGKYFATGIAYANSTVAATYTAGSAGDLLLDITYI